MFRRSKADPFADPELGELTWSRGGWRGQVSLGPLRSVPLFVPGSRREPDSDALAVARTVSLEVDRVQASIRAALDEHRAPYEDAAPLAADDTPPPTYAAVIDLDGRLTIELGFEVSWDEEHTLGARLRDGQVIELNGSVLEP